MGHRPGADRADAGITLDEKAERLHLALPSRLEPGTATVNITFQGVLNDKLRGFYRSTFTDTDGAERVIATTQMEATFARMAFPCWDEPEHKAIFSIRLVVPDHLTALSNGSETDRRPAGEGRVCVEFADTIPMSTYLVAFIVGPLEISDAVDVGGIPLRIAHPKGKAHLAPYALDVAAAALRYYTDYYAIAYPGGKLDHVAIPDFAFGAMENQGCITYREVLLLVDPSAATTPELMNLVDVVNHETAHMWFGNLVTMKWWNGIWLNEAFATFMEMKATEAWRPDWHRFVEFGLSRTMAMDTDSLDSTRPIEFEVESPADAEGMFDILTYEKGGAILRMLEQYLGEDRFRDGVRRYLADNAYGNTENSDLWDAIEAVTGEPVRRIMDSWIFQGGHPIVSVERADGGRLRLRQERFRLSEAVDPDGGVRDDLGDAWAVPVRLRLGRPDGTEEVVRVVLDGPEDLVEVGDIEWVNGNAGGEGAYRVHYAPDLRTALVQHGIGRLEVLERYGVLNDAHAATLAGSLPAAELLELARAYADEGDVAVWKLLASVLDTLDRALPDDERAGLAAHVRGLAGPALRRLGFAPDPADDDRTRELRGTLFRLNAILGDDPEVGAEAARLRAAELATPGSVDPALVAAATLITVHRDTGGEAFQLGLARFGEAETPQEEVRELYSLARTRVPTCFDDLLERALTEVRSQNGPYLLRFAIENRTLGPRAWDHIRRNWEQVNERFPTNSIVRMLEGVRTLTDETVAADVQAFFAEHEVPQGAKQLAQHLERQRIGVDLRRREGTALADTLRGVSPGS